MLFIPLFIIAQSLVRQMSFSVIMSGNVCVKTVPFWCINHTAAAYHVTLRIPTYHNSHCNIKAHRIITNMCESLFTELRHSGSRKHPNINMLGRDRSVIYATRPNYTKEKFQHHGNRHTLHQYTKRTRGMTPLTTDLSPSHQSHAN